MENNKSKFYSSLNEISMKTRSTTERIKPVKNEM